MDKIHGQRVIKSVLSYAVWTHVQDKHKMNVFPGSR